MVEFEGQAVVVIGGSGGLGSVIVRTAAEHGASVGFSYRSNKTAAEALSEDLRSRGAISLHQSLDLRDSGSVESFLEKMATDLGRIDAIIHTAGADIPLEYIGEIDPDDFATAIEDDLVGFFRLVKAGLPYLRQTRGSLVALTSAGVARHPPRDILSTAPKAGMEAIVRAVAREEGRFGIRANSVGVGTVQAGLWHRLAERVPEGFMDAAAQNTALRRHGTAEEIANAAVFLASSAAGFITGHSLTVDGGYAV